MSIARHLYYLARTHLEQTASVHLISEKHTFRLRGSDGTLVADFPAVGLDNADLIDHMPIEEAPIFKGTTE